MAPNSSGLGSPASRLSRLRLFWNDMGCPIGGLDEAVGLVVVDAAFRLGVELDGASHGRGEVGQVADARGEMALADFGEEVVGLAAANGGDLVCRPSIVVGRCGPSNGAASAAVMRRTGRKVPLGHHDRLVTAEQESDQGLRVRMTRNPALEMR